MSQQTVTAKWAFRGSPLAKSKAFNLVRRLIASHCVKIQGFRLGWQGQIMGNFHHIFCSLFDTNLKPPHLIIIGTLFNYFYLPFSPIVNEFVLLIFTLAKQKYS
jgi:hypothetical protein